MQVIKAPAKLEFNGPSVFLAGSIEMGRAINWQIRMEQALKNISITILNPRRDDWDSAWVQSIENPQFREQVEWELDAMDKANKIAMYFDPATKSPISLLELGLFADSGKLIVCCPEGFWRKGNVDIVCERQGVCQVETLEKIIERVKEIEI